MPGIGSLKKARDISTEGLQVVSKKARQLSAEGLQVVFQRPRRESAEGLQVVFDSSPEVVPKNERGDKIPVDGDRTVSSNPLYGHLRKKIRGIRVIWIAVAASIFVTGILLGGAIVATLESKRKSTPNAAQASSSTSAAAPGSTQASQLGHMSSATLSSMTNSRTLSSTATIIPPDTRSASIAALSTSISASEMNLQKFTDALGGAAAPPIIGTTGSSFAVNGSTFTTLSEAIQRSCDVQFTSCKSIENDQSAPIAGTTQCSDQQTDCLDAGAGTS